MSGYIVAIDTPEKLSAQYQAREILDLPNHLLMPAASLRVMP